MTLRIARLHDPGCGFAATAADEVEAPNRAGEPRYIGRPKHGGRGGEGRDTPAGNGSGRLRQPRVIDRAAVAQQKARSTGSLGGKMQPARCGERDARRGLGNHSSQAALTFWIANHRNRRWKRAREGSAAHPSIGILSEEPIANSEPVRRKRLETVGRFIKASRVEIRSGRNEACLVPGLKYFQLPQRLENGCTDCTTLHELTH